MNDKIRSETKKQSIPKKNINEKSSNENLIAKSNDCIKLSAKTKL